LYGPVRAPETAGIGVAIVTISLDGWPEGGVTPTTHGVDVVAPKPGPKPEPVSPRLFKTLIHSDRRASVPNVKFSRDGSKLLTAGYPSGVVQLWDTASWKELRRIEAPPGLRGSADYAIVSPDWATLYVIAGKRTANKFERDGKQVWKLEFDDEVRRWDLANGKPLTALKLGKNELLEVRPTPDGKSLIVDERPPYESGQDAHGVVNAYDLPSGSAHKLADEYGHPIFSPDGKTVALTVSNYRSWAAQVLLFDAANWKQLASWNAPEKCSIYAGAFSPDGKWLAVSGGGPKAQLLQMHLFEAATLKLVQSIPGHNGENGFSGFRTPLFTPDSKTLIAIESAGRIHVFDLETQRDEQPLSLPAKFRSWFIELSPDGKTLAVYGQAVHAVPGVSAEDVTPEDLPQPRIFLFDLPGRRLAEEIVCPHGHWGGLSFCRDGKTLAAGGTGAVHLFDLRSAAKK
jgi:WD40 repeat protein